MRKAQTLPKFLVMGQSDFDGTRASMEIRHRNCVAVILGCMSVANSEYNTKVLEAVNWLSTMRETEFLPR